MPQGLTRHRRTRASALAIGLGLIIGLLSAAPVAAETDDVDQRAQRARVTTDVRPTAERTERPERPERDLEVLRLACGIADDETTAPDVVANGDEGASDATRVHIGCRWRAATSDRAVGYQLWRIVDRGERELVARGGLDLLAVRDVVAADTHLVRYAVIALDQNGNRVGQSRVERVVVVELDDHDKRLAARARTQAVLGR